MRGACLGRCRTAAFATALALTVVLAGGAAGARASGPVPSVSGLSPSSGGSCGGETVTINGSGFTGTSAVTFTPNTVGGSTPQPAATFTVNSDTRITVVVPNLFAGGGATGSQTYDVQVRTPGGISRPANYTASEAAGAATVWAVSAPSGYPTDQVTILGANFCNASHVSFAYQLGCNGSYQHPPDPQEWCDQPYGAAKFTVLNDDVIIATVPADNGPVPPTQFGVSPGPVDVQVWDDWEDQDPGTGLFDIHRQAVSAATPGDHFTYVMPPFITGVSPGDGPVTGGTTVQLSGSRFTGATEVDFGAQKAKSFTVNNDGSITAVAPSAAAAGVVAVSVVGTGPRAYDTSFGFDGFTYEPVPPSISGIDPGEGPTVGGNTVQITGSGFDQADQNGHATPVSSVSFGGVAATSFTVQDDSHISAVAPVHAHGVVHVTLSSAVGTSAQTVWDLYTYGPSPTVTGVSPRTGPASGGNLVSIHGTHFDRSSVVSFKASDVATFASAPSGAQGSFAATSTYVSPTLIKVLAPVHAPGYTDVVVTNTDPSNPGVSLLSSADAYVYALTLSAPAVPGWLASQTHNGGASPSASALAKTGGLTLALKPKVPGTATLDWWYPAPPKSHLARATVARSVLVASGRQRFSGRVAATLRLRLTAAGRRLLKAGARRRLTATATFTPARGRAIRAARTFTLRL
jgi:hypothetical protein